MKQNTATNILLPLILFLTLPLSAQFREYLVEGRILDPKGTPLSAVTVVLHDMDSSRSYSFDSNKSGIYRFVGIPHGRYRVTFSREGWKSISTEWDLSTPQQRIQKVKMDDAIMVSNDDLARIDQDRAIKEIIDAAKVLYENKDYDAVIEQLRPIVGAHPNDIHTAYLFAMATLAKGDIDNAQTIFTDIISTFPDFTQAHIQLGYCYQKQNLLPQALAHYLTADKQKPDQFMVLYNIGMIYYMLEKPTEALPVLNRALSFAQAEVDLLETIAMCHIQLKDYDKALLELKKALEKSKDESRKSTLQALVDDLQNSRQGKKTE